MAISAFPTIKGLGYPQKRTPSFVSDRHEAMSNKRTIVPQTTIPRWTWELPFNFLRAAAFDGRVTYAEFETLVAFFNARQVDGMVFRYTDPDDKATANIGFGVGDGVTTKFQLYRSIAGFSEPVYDPTITEVQVAGVPTAAYVLGSLGVVTFNVAPAAAAALTWTGTFNWLCRFNDDKFDFQRVMRGLYEAPDALRFSNEINP